MPSSSGALDLNRQGGVDDLIGRYFRVTEDLLVSIKNRHHGLSRSAVRRRSRNGRNPSSEDHHKNAANNYTPSPKHEDACFRRTEPSGEVNAARLLDFSSAGRRR